MGNTRVKMIIDTLRDNPHRKFTARELAREFLVRYPEDLAEKRLNPRFDTEEKLIAQLAAEVGAGRMEAAKKVCPQVATRDKPRPRVYYWESHPEQAEVEEEQLNAEVLQDESVTQILEKVLSEHDLYPLLIEFLNKEYKLYCRRINEKTSKNSHGSRGNHWLHPDIVALEPMDGHWDEVVKECVRHGGGRAIRLWSFEMKKHLNKSNVREAFFQAVSNSGWANYGYLVAVSMSNDVEAELQMLSGLHGIGVLLLDTESLFDSQILIPARERLEVDWQSVNRIVTENRDFHRFIEQVGIYNQTRRLVKAVWNK
ncbi:hypothetical protein AAEX37_00334 [Oligella sp. MSHR50489EDL]|uniref:COG2958 family protein n=1 Tax=Oligella sp. MSHR50489EDL TaxID=3139409 RepID=UPI003D817EAC